MSLHLKKIRFTNCPCCNATSFITYYNNSHVKKMRGWRDFFYGSRDFISDIIECKDCGFKFINTLHDNYQRFYQDNETIDYKKMRPYRINYFKKVKRKLESIKWFQLPPSAKILDLGCADGDWLMQWKGKADLFGAETSAHFLSDLDSKGIRHVDENFLASQTFDFISMFDYLEHCEDPLEQLRRIKSLLSEKGYMAISVPDMNKWLAILLGQRYYLYCPMHFSYFTRNSLEKLLLRVFQESQIIFFSSPIMKSDINSLLKWTGINWRAPEKFNVTIPIGYSSNIFAIVTNTPRQFDR